MNKPLLFLKNNLSPKNWRKVRCHVIKYLDRCREIERLSSKRYFLDMHYHNTIRNTKLIKFHPQDNITLDNIISAVNNSLNAIKNTGAKKFYYTILSHE